MAIDIGFANALGGIATGINRADEINRQRYMQDQELALRQQADQRAQEAHSANMTTQKRAWEIQDADQWANGQEIYGDLLAGKMDKPFDFAVKHPAEAAQIAQAGVAPVPGQVGTLGASPSPSALPTVADAPAGRGGNRAGAGSPSGKDTTSVLRSGKSNSLFGSQGTLDEANSARDSFNKELTKYNELYADADTPAKRRALNARYEKKLADLANTARTKKVEADAMKVMEMGAEAVNELLAGNNAAANPILEALWGPEMVKMFEGATPIKGRNRLQLKSGTILDPASMMALVDKTATLADKQKALQHLGDQLAQDYRNSQSVWASTQRMEDTVEKVYKEDLIRFQKDGVTPDEAEKLRKAGITIAPNSPLAPELAKKAARFNMSDNRHAGGKGNTGFAKPEQEQAKLDSKERIIKGQRAIETKKAINAMRANPMTMADALKPENIALERQANEELSAALNDPNAPSQLQIDAALLNQGTAQGPKAIPGQRLNQNRTAGNRPTTVAAGTALPL